MQPALRGAVPADWIPLPEVAAAARTASVVRGTRSVVAAWGDPGDGCFLTAVEVYGHHRDRVRTAIDRLGTHLDAPAAVHAWQVPATDDIPAEVNARLTVGVTTGAVRAIFAMDARALPRAALAACFHNDREPAACEALCTRLLPLLQAPPAPLPSVTP
jgi:hypothetical protein